MGKFAKINFLKCFSMELSQIDLRNEEEFCLEKKHLFIIHYFSIFSPLCVLSVLISSRWTISNQPCSLYYFLLQVKSHSVVNLRDVTEDSPILVTEKNTVMFTHQTNHTIVKSEVATSLILILPVLENI